MEQLGSHWTDFHEIWYVRIFRKYVKKIQVILKSDKNKGYFTWGKIYIFLILSRSFLLRLRNISDKSCRENQNTHFVLSNVFLKSCRVWNNVEKYCRVGQVTIWRMRIACWIPKATNTHTHAVQYSLPFHVNNGCTNAPQFYVIRTLPVSFIGFNLPAFVSIRPDGPQLYSTSEIKYFIVGLN